MAPAHQIRADYVPLSESDLRDTLLEFCSVGNRFVGSPGERAAREWLLEAFAEAGLSNVRAEPFDVLGYQPGTSTCTVVPGGPSLPPAGFQHTAAASVEAEAVYIGRPQSPADIVALDARGNRDGIEARFDVETDSLAVRADPARLRALRATVWL